jgi:hypothetical protein
MGPYGGKAHCRSLQKQRPDPFRHRAFTLENLASPLNALSPRFRDYPRKGASHFPIVASLYRHPMI